MRIFDGMSSFRRRIRHKRQDLSLPAPRNVAFDLDAFQAGCAAVIGRIYLAFGERLLHDTRRCVGRAEADSVVHDVFVELLQNPKLRAQFQGGSLLAWLREIARLKSLEHLRRVGHQIPARPPELSRSSEGTLEARSVLLRFLHERVPNRQKQFFSLRFLASQSQAEVSARLQVPRSTLEGWEHRLVQQLRAFVFETPQTAPPSAERLSSSSFRRTIGHEEI